ncbi:cell surface protein SprA [Runella sp. MFBS21]|uniref:T9SS outer membrane translocon Sov/SprA n=1 Tax=Runella sp. MFBS21 TaxID=3034018 RepID=UPI0023F8643C|nr:cell surface protein SprA [Runella sp. MFBS21]MDF7821943.1 cell surface protein SprA [Runella sp. MFBS21]
MAQSQPTNRRSTTPDTSHSNRQSRRLLYSTWMDRFGNRFNYVPSRSSLYLRDPKSLSNEFRLDSTGRMSVYERIGDTKLPPLNYRNPLTMSYEDFQKLQDKRVFEYLRREYSAKQDGKGALGARGLLPKLDLPPGFDRVFGSNIVDFKPNGFVLLDFGVINQKNQDPNIPIRQRNQTNFLFNEQININFNGKIGDKLGMLTNFDTKSSFNFENQLKLDYRPGKANLPTTPNVPGMGQTGVNGLGQNSTFGQGFGPQSYIPENESIIQGVQAGNVNWQLPSQLIPGVQNLFGAKVDLRFGRLTATVVASQQRSRQQCITLRGGVQNRAFEIRADAYDENRHFFLGYFFRNNYERWLGNLPMIMSGITVTRLEVYVTNRTNNTETLRNIVGFSDLGESTPANTTNPNLQPISANQPINNKSNGLFAKVTTDNELREADKTSFALDSRYNLQRGTDYDLLRGARKLSEREYKFQPELGYISLLTPLRNDEILAVAYEYTFNGQKYKVGELTEDYQSRRDDEVLVLKLLKSSTIRNNTAHPMWNLMMKNIYSLNTTQVAKQNFQLRVIYKDDLTGIDNPNLQEGPIANIPLVKVMGLDRLNSLNDPVFDSQRNPVGDGNFDFIEGVTIDSRMGRVIFPVLEPFGANLAKQFVGQEVLANKYVFNELYRSTQIDAQQITEKNKYFLKGSFQGAAGGSTVQLPFGVSDKSVTVRAGGVQLQQGIDYSVEGQSGAVRIINESVTNSGRDIEICYEQPDLFQNQIRTLLGTRLNYTVNRDMQVGVTAMRLRETPPGFLTRASLGNDPVSNSIIGADLTFRKESRLLTKLLDKLPLLETKEISSVQFQGEVAQSFAGLHPQVRNRIYIDDFEAARTQFDLTRQPNRWRLGATPAQFPQGTPTDPLPYAYNRAKISAYTIDISFSPQAQAGLRERPQNITPQDFNNFYERLFRPQDIFKGRGQYLVNLPESILDIAYFPQERGMYNYTTDLDANGLLRNPRNNFGAITRAIGSDVDFDNANVEIVEFWLMDPFKEGPNGVVKDGIVNRNNTTGGKLYFNLGEISEDVIKNGRYDFENGLPLVDKVATSTPDQPANVAETAWGYSTRQQYIINAFTNEPEARAKQDIGLDGLSNLEERDFFSEYIQRLPTNLTTEARNQILADPSGDDFEFYFSAKADSANKKIVERYKNYMGMENNTPEFNSTSEITPASTNLPDIEDLNVDNTINDQEAYYEYEIDLQKDQLGVGKPYIVDVVTAPNDNGDFVNWYLFRVPVREYTKKVGNINGFKSIRFIRMYLTGWSEPVVLRFAQLQMVATQYRKYTGDLNARGLQEVPEPYDAQFKIATVSVEENGTAPTDPKAQRYIYTVPPGVQRDVDFTTPNQRPLNEQAMSLCVTDLRDGDSRAAFKNVQSQNLLFRERLKMYVHMHDAMSGQVSAFMRLGTDVTEHYYEIEVTNLQATLPNRDIPEEVWPAQNEIDVEIPWLIEAKAERDRQPNPSLSAPYTVTKTDNLGRVYRITVVGRPDLSNVMVIMIGMRNPRSVDQSPQSFCIWVNELHVQGFDNQSGTAAIARADIKLADFATVQMAGKWTTFGFGGVQQKLADRSRDNTTEFSISSAIALDKLLDEKWGFKIPLYVNYDIKQISPHFNPYDPDTPLAMSLANYAENDPRRLQLENAAIEKAERRGFNFSNVRKTKTNPNAKRHFWDFENFAFTYAYNEQTRRSSMVADYTQRQYRGGIVYQYGFPQRPWEPLRNIKGFERPYLELLKDFNLSLLPTQIAIRFDADRSFIRTQYRSGDLSDVGQYPLFEKYFLFNRAYDLNWNLTKNVVLTYSALANAIIDEPLGNIDTEIKRDSVWRNFRSFGRMKNYDQKIKLTYRLPLEKIPLLDWMTADYNHNINYQFSPITSFSSSLYSGTDGLNSSGLNNATYNTNTSNQSSAFTAGGYRLTDTDNYLLGNSIRNGREQSIRGKVDFVKLYNKLRYLRFANNPSPPRKNFARSPGDDEDVAREPSKLLKNITRLLMTVRGIDVDYTIQKTTMLPGYLPGSQGVWGLEGTKVTSLTHFIFGSQSPNVLYDAAAKGDLTRSTMLNVPFVQTDSRLFRINTRLEPFKDFKIQINAQLKRGDEYRMFYRVTDSTDRTTYRVQSPVRSGNFQMSFMSFRTAFAKINKDNSSPIFDQFKANRAIVLERLMRREGKPENVEYNLNSQDVLIAAFFAAYNGKDANEVRTNPFLGFPLPNWRVDYGGLSQIPFFKKIFSAFTLEHSYQSTYSVGNFTSALDYNEAYTQYLTLDNRDYQLALLGGENNNAIPIFVMSTITLSERFFPLIGFRARTQNKIDLRLTYNQDRTISLNLSNAQLAEMFNRDITASVGFTRNNVRIPFRINGEFKKLKNDLLFQCNFTIRDTRTVQRRFDEPPTAIMGNYNFQLRPQVNYTVSKLWSIQFYFDRTFNNPYVLNSYRRATTAGGIQVRFNVAEL